MAKKEKMRRAFADSIHVDDAKVEINYTDIEVEASYDGPRLDDEMKIDADWVKNLLEYMQGQKKLHKRYLVQLVNFCAEWYDKQDSLVDVKIPE